MLSKFRRRLTYANVMSTLCFFLLLGGSSYAAVSLKRNSVKGKHIAKNAISSPKVKDGGLRVEDFAPGQLPRGETGPPGAPNPNAADSDLLDGLDSNAFLRSDGTATDADKLDGVDSDGFARRNSARARAYSIPKGYGGPGGFWAMFMGSNQPAPTAMLRYSCPSDLSQDGILRYRNWSGQTVNLFSDNGSANPDYRQLANEAVYDQPAADSGERITFQAQSGEGVATWEVFSVHRPASNDCHVQFTVTSGTTEF